MYRCRFLHCGLVSGSPEECAGTGKSGDAFRGIAGDRFVGDVVCYDPWVAAVLCLPVGFTIIAAVASINTLLQTLSGEDKRGRVMGYMAMSFTGMAPVGSMVLGAIEKWIGLQMIILLSGICCFVAALVFEYYRPLVRRYARPVYIEKGIIKEIALG